MVCLRGDLLVLHTPASSPEPEVDNLMNILGTYFYSSSYNAGIIVLF
jgi:hypothetical protein